MAVERIREVRGTALPLRGDDIDTDRILPARFLKAVTFDGLERYLFEDDRRAIEAAGGNPHPVANPAYAKASILLVNGNFGCGSSREHAPQAIRRRGIRTVIGESFSEIFFGNAVALGMPCATAAGDTVNALMSLAEADPSAAFVVDLREMRVSAGGQAFDIALPASARDAFLDGGWDATGLLLENFDEVRAAASRLPYVTARW